MRARYKTRLPVNVGGSLARNILLIPRFKLTAMQLSIVLIGVPQMIHHKLRRMSRCVPKGVILLE
jgi:hypothetical protein